MNNHDILFEDFLPRHGQQAWWTIVESLVPKIHEVDRDATRIWFYFWPLWLARALEEEPDFEKLARELELKGNYRLYEQIDTSHDFLYGHRFWPAIKSAVRAHAESGEVPESLELAEQIRAVAGRVAAESGADVSLLLGTTAVAFMTVQQVGLEAFAASDGQAQLEPKAARRSPAQILAARAKNDGQGIFGFLRGPMRLRFTVTFDEGRKTARFSLLNGQELTSAALLDSRDHSDYGDSRCMPGEGPIPTECRSAACGTCWVGVLGGNERLTEVGELEGRRIKKFGYTDTDDPRPLIRLACKARAAGNVTIVIPPWNGVFGRYLEGAEKIAIGGAAADPEEEAAFEPRRH